MSATATQPNPGTGRGGKYLTLYIADEEYGFPIMGVREIIGLLSVTPVPQTPDYVLGVINLRGKVIPVIELRHKFDMESIEATDESCIIVVQTDDVGVGILVDKVREVRDIDDADIVDAPSLGGEVETDYILGIGKSEDQVTLLLDIEKILTQEQLGELQGISDAADA